MSELALIAGGWGVVRASSLWRTRAWPTGSGPDYVNAAMALPGGVIEDGPGRPEAILARLHAIEARAGRARGRVRWAPRPLDLDLLAVGDLVIPDAETQSRWREGGDAPPAPDRLILPHPRLHERAFVLAPLAEVAPLWRHPLTGLSVEAMLSALTAAEGRPEILAAGGPDAEGEGEGGSPR